MRNNKIGIMPITNENGAPNWTRRDSDASVASVSAGSAFSNKSARQNWEAQYTKKELKEWRQLFGMFDTDSSGAIGNEELKEAMKSIGMAANEAEIDNIIREVDADGNGEIDLEEFCACLKKSQSLVKSTNEELIKECFIVFDQDGNGIITENEFKYIAKEIGGFSDDLAEKVFRELDVSSNGHISADQFATVVEDYLLTERPDAHSMDKISDVVPEALEPN